LNWEIFVKQIHARVPVIDIFAGPGGLGEGFSAYPIEGTESVFRIRLSLEKEENAHRTLQLREVAAQLTASAEGIMIAVSARLSDYVQKLIDGTLLLVRRRLSSEVESCR
jgi:hypothetical protein